MGKNPYPVINVSTRGWGKKCKFVLEKLLVVQPERASSLFVRTTDICSILITRICAIENAGPFVRGNFAPL